MEVPEEDRELVARHYDSYEDKTRALVPHYFLKIWNTGDLALTLRLDRLPNVQGIAESRFEDDGARTLALDMHPMMRRERGRARGSSQCAHRDGGDRHGREHGIDG